MDHDYAARKESASEDDVEENKKRNTNYCCVPQCSNYAGKGIHLHLFPKDVDLKKAWEVALRMGKPASTSMKVCSTHFLPSDYFPGGM